MRELDIFSLISKRSSFGMMRPPHICVAKGYSRDMQGRSLVSCHHLLHFAKLCSPHSVVDDLSASFRYHDHNHYRALLLLTGLRDQRLACVEDVHGSPQKSIDLTLICELMKIFFSSQHSTMVSPFCS